MSEWNEDAESFLDAFRDDVEVDVDVDAAWARFEAEAMPIEPAANQRPLLWWVGVGVVAAALALVWFARPASRVDRSAHGGVGQQAVDEAVERHTGGTPVPAADSRSQHREPEAEAPVPAPTLQPKPEPEPAAETGVVDESPRRRRPGRPVGKDDAPEPSVGPSRLAEELKLLESMRAATKAGRFADALSRVREHAETYGKGPFAAERELTRVRALCGLGRVADARKAQDRFSRAFPGSHLGTLVRGACGGDDEKNPKSDHDG